MTTYCFACDMCSKQFERDYSKSPGKINGGQCPECGSDSVSRDYRAEQGKQRSGGHGWPHASYAAGVNPAQAKEAEKYCQEHGVQTDYDGQGDPIMRDRSHRKKFHDMMGLCDLDAGYGDQAPQNR